MEKKSFLSTVFDYPTQLSREEVAYLREHKLFSPEHWQRKLKCSFDPKQGIIVRGLSYALAYQYIEANPWWAHGRIVIDVDHADAATAWERAGLPPPTWIVINPRSGHAHVVYMIRDPVLHGPNARRGPTVLERIVCERLRIVLGGDRCYTRLLTRNPCYLPRDPGHHGDDAQLVLWTGALYDLSSMNEWVPDVVYAAKLEEEQRRLGPRFTSVGPVAEMNGTLVVPDGTRNSSLFHFLFRWACLAFESFAGTEAAWRALCVARALESRPMSLRDGPLDNHECEEMASKIAKYIYTRWLPLAELIARTHTPRLQRERGLRSGAARRAASKPLRDRAMHLLHDGWSPSDVAKELGVHVATLWRWRKAA